MGVGHAGCAQQLPSDLGRVDVLATRNEHVVGALLHVQQAVAKHGRVAREEESVHRVGGARVQIALEQAGAFDGKATEAVLPRIDDVRPIGRHEPQTSTKCRSHQAIRYLAGRLGHAVARVHPRADRQRPFERARIHRPAPQQDARVATHGVYGQLGARRKQILQHLVDHRNVGGAASGRVGQHARGVETAIQDEGRAVQQAAHHHLEAADVVKRQHRLPQALAATVEHRVGHFRRRADVLPGEGHGF